MARSGHCTFLVVRGVSSHPLKSNHGIVETHTGRRTLCSQRSLVRVLLATWRSHLNNAISPQVSSSQFLINERSSPPSNKDLTGPHWFYCKKDQILQSAMVGQLCEDLANYHYHTYCHTAEVVPLLFVQA